MGWREGLIQSCRESQKKKIKKDLTCQSAGDTNLKLDCLFGELLTV